MARVRDLFFAKRLAGVTESVAKRFAADPAGEDYVHGTDGQIDANSANYGHLYTPETYDGAKLQSSDGEGDFTTTFEELCAQVLGDDSCDGNLEDLNDLPLGLGRVEAIDNSTAVSVPNGTVFDSSTFAAVADTQIVETSVEPRPEVENKLGDCEDISSPVIPPNILLPSYKDAFNFILPDATAAAVFPIGDCERLPSPGIPTHDHSNIYPDSWSLFGISTLSAEEELRLAKIKSIRNKFRSYKTVTKLLAAFEDIWIENKGIKLSKRELKKEIFDYFYEIETEQPISHEYMKSFLMLSKRNRSHFVNWLFRSIKRLNLMEEYYHLAVFIFDRYCQNVRSNIRIEIKMITVTLLYMVGKLAKNNPPKIQECIAMGNNSFSPRQITDLERNILRVMEFKLQRPTALHFLAYFVEECKNLKIGSVHFSLAKYFIALALPEHDLCAKLPSELAAAALYLAINLQEQRLNQRPKGLIAELWTLDMEHCTHYTVQHLTPITQKIAQVVHDAPESAAISTYLYKQYIFIEYCTESLAYLARNGVLYGPVMKSIITQMPHTV